MVIGYKQLQDLIMLKRLVDLLFNRRIAWTAAGRNKQEDHRSHAVDRFPETPLLEPNEQASATAERSGRATRGRLTATPPAFETLFDSLRVRSGARRLSSDWESTRLKIELSPVQIREAAYSEATNGVRSRRNDANRDLNPGSRAQRAKRASTSSSGSNPGGGILIPRENRGGWYAPDRQVPKQFTGVERLDSIRSGSLRGHASGDCDRFGYARRVCKSRR